MPGTFEEYIFKAKKSGFELLAIQLTSIGTVSAQNLSVCSVYRYIGDILTYKIGGWCFCAGSEFNMLSLHCK